MKIVALTIAIAFTSCFGKHPLKTGHVGENLPSIDLLLLDSVTKKTTIQLNNSDNVDAIVLLLFSPDCPHCRVLTSELIDKIQSLSHIRFCLISVSSYNMIKEYSEHFHLERYPTITVGQDYKNSFISYFKPVAVPYVAVYGKDKRLRQVITGKVDVGSIKDIALQ